jgi:uncharacterized lipoprotein YajG
MNNRLVAVALASLLVAGCEQQPATPSGGQPASSPSPAPTTPTPAETASPLTTPAPTPTAESQATPTATPETTPAATPETTPTASSSEATPAATPETTPPAPATTQDAVAPSPSSSPLAAGSESRPTLSSRSANEYLESYDAYISDFKTAYQAMKQGDMTKYQSVIQRAHELQTKSEKLGGELTPEEEQQFANYLNKKANELTAFASQNH